MKQKLFKFLRRINPKFKTDAQKLYEYLQKQNDYVATRHTPFKFSWDYWDQLIDFLNDGNGLFIDNHFKNGLLLVADKGKIRNLDIAVKRKEVLPVSISGNKTCRSIQKII